MAAAAAPPRRRRNRVSVVVFDAKKQAYLVFSLKMKHIFSDRPDESDHEVQRYFPPALAVFEVVEGWEHMDFAAYGANNVVAITSMARTLVYDAGSDSVTPGPALHAVKYRPILVPVGDSAFLAISGKPRVPGPHFESLDLAAAGSAPAYWRALPDLPGPVSNIMASGCSEVTGYFVAGTRVWVSVHGMGTFSFDMTSREWRKEGAWLLPVVGRAVLAPDMDGLLLGFRSRSAHHLCACDVEARPPVIRARWEGEAFPREWCGRNGYGLHAYPADLTYFGGGRFCTAVKMRGACVHSRSFLCITALQVTTNLDLIKRRFRCYLMEPEQEIAFFL